MDDYESKIEELNLQVNKRLLESSIKDVNYAASVLGDYFPEAYVAVAEERDGCSIVPVNLLSSLSMREFKNEKKCETKYQKIIENVSHFLFLVYNIFKKEAMFMNNNVEIMNTLHYKHNLEEQLNNIICGSIEVREKDEKRYIYVHYRELGRNVSKYVGEYSDDLYNLILNNNLKSKELKKEIKTLEKKLKELNYQESELSEEVKLNIDFAKRNLVDSIYNQAMLEGVVTTYADTESIIEGGQVNGMTSTDIMKVINLKHAWEFVLDENVIMAEENFSFLSQINKLILEGFYYNAGKVRSTPAKIGGTNWVPGIPIESQVVEELNGLLNSKLDDVSLAIELLLYVMKRQIFIDGNKRTAVILANHHLISRGLGIISIPGDLVEDYKKLLIMYYEGKDTDKIKKFLRDKCYVSLK